jgi:hypothetical protein
LSKRSDRRHGTLLIKSAQSAMVVRTSEGGASAAMLQRVIFRFAFLPEISSADLASERKTI